MINLVKQNKLFAPAEYWNLTPFAKKEIVNGCGPGNWKFDLIPDKILGLPISEVCNIHDYMYHVGITNDDKLTSDMVFLVNLIRHINRHSNSIMRRVRRIFAYRYYEAVYEHGKSAFWSGKEHQVK